MKQLTEDQARQLVAFLGENWAQFVQHAEVHGMEEAEADELYQALGGDE